MSYYDSPEFEEEMIEEGRDAEESEESEDYTVCPLCGKEVTTLCNNGDCS